MGLERSPVLRKLLKLFRDNENKILTKDDIVKAVWNREYDPLIDDNTLYINIHRLKKFLLKSESLNHCMDGYKYTNTHSLASQLRRMLDKYQADNETGKRAVWLIEQAIDLLERA